MASWDLRFTSEEPDNNEARIGVEGMNREVLCRDGKVLPSLFFIAELKAKLEVDGIELNGSRINFLFRKYYDSGNNLSYSGFKHWIQLSFK